MADLAATYREQGKWNEAEGLDMDVIKLRKRLEKMEVDVIKLRKRLEKLEVDLIKLRKR